jgi:hypothetical protein
MRPRFPRRKKKMEPADYASAVVRGVMTAMMDTPLQHAHEHVVKHEPYPQPSEGHVRVIAADGQTVWTGAIYCRGGAYNSLDIHGLHRVYPELSQSAIPLRLEFRWEY